MERPTGADVSGNVYCIEGHLLGGHAISCIVAYVTTPLYTTPPKLPLNEASLGLIEASQGGT